VCIATPDHWHAVQAIQAMQAGKDVYVEKPLTNHARRGAEDGGRPAPYRPRRAGRPDRRGSPLYQELVPLVRDGLSEKVTTARAYRVDNMHPNESPDGSEAPPPGFDWDMWLGPAPPAHTSSTSRPTFPVVEGLLVTDGQLGVHYMDAIRC